MMTLRDYIIINKNMGCSCELMEKEFKEALDNIYVDDSFDILYMLNRRPYYRITVDNAEGKIEEIHFLLNSYKFNSDKVFITDHSGVKYPLPEEIIADIVPIMHKGVTVTIEITEWDECPDYIKHRKNGYTKLWLDDDYRNRFIAKYLKRDTVCVIRITDTKIFIITDKEKINAGIWLEL